MGSVQYGLSVKQAHTHSHALQSCRFPVGGFHPQGTETELLRRRVNQPPRTAVSPGGCGRPRWEPGMDAAGDKRDSAGSLIFPLFFGREYNCVSLRHCKNHLEKIFLKNSTPPEGNLAKSIKAKNALKKEYKERGEGRKLVK